MPYYRDLRQYLQTLEAEGRLCRVTRPINKDTELNALVRLQFRGLPEEERRAFFFEQVVDGRGRHFHMPVVVACMAASRAIYALGMGCAPGQIGERWEQAQRQPIPPRLVSSGPVQEVVFSGEALRQPGSGLDALPIPISTPGFDNAPYTSASHWVTRDPETGKLNMGNYRGHLKSQTRLGCFVTKQQGLAQHWRKCKERRQPLQAAVVIGVTPNLSYVATAKLPDEVEEFGVAGGIAGEPVELVRCRSVDLEVPAQAELVIEGVIPTDCLEMEGPFGEFTGYMAKREMAMFMEVSCITQRRQPIYQAFISQFPPSESSKLRQIAKEEVIAKHLTVDCGFKGIRGVALHEAAGSWGICVIQVDRRMTGEAWGVLEALARHQGLATKMAIAVDEDIDITDLEAITWAMSFNMQPHRDVKVVPIRSMDLDYSLAPPEERYDILSKAKEASGLLIDATRKWAYPPVSLPARPYMERALAMWQELGLPALRLKQPWYGYPLGYWTAEDELEAELATRGEHYQTGERLAQRRLQV